jgi:hypothetical protein
MGVKVNLHSRAEQDLQDIKSYLVQHAGAQAADSHFATHSLSRLLCHCA